MRRKLEDSARVAPCGAGKNLNCIVIHGCLSDMGTEEFPELLQAVLK